MKFNNLHKKIRDVRASKRMDNDRIEMGIFVDFGGATIIFVYLDYFLI